MVKALDLRSNGSIPAWVRTPPVVIVLIIFSRKTEGGKNFQLDPDGDRTRNLLIRSQTPYPLGHKATSITELCNMILNKTLVSYVLVSLQNHFS